MPLKSGILLTQLVTSSSAGLHIPLVISHHVAIGLLPQPSVIKPRILTFSPFC